MKSWYTFEFRAKITENDMVGQEKNNLRMLERYFKTLANLFYDCYKCLRILTNDVANLTNVLRMTQQHDTCLYLHIHIAGLSFCFLFARFCPISLFPIILIHIVRILSLSYENINTNANESLHCTNVKYVHYKCVAIDQNGLRPANMRLYEFY